MHDETDTGGMVHCRELLDRSHPRCRRMERPDRFGSQFAGELLHSNSSVYPAIGMRCIVDLSA